MQSGRLERELLDLLTLRARIVSTQMVAEHWFAHAAHPQRAAGSALSRLVSLGLLSKQRGAVRAHRPFSEQPLVSWAPGEPEPDFSRVSALSRARWGRGESVQLLYSATKLAASRTGGSATRAVRASEASHDLAVGALYLHLKQIGHEGLSSWRGEDRFDIYRDFLPGDVVPDAIVLRDGEPLALELIGRYAPGKVERFHLACEAVELRYELW